jgi:hypothetical protein
MLAAGPLLVLVAAAAGSGRIAARSHHLEDRLVRVRVWGSEPQRPDNAPILVKRIWALGAGLHLNAVTGNGARPLHIKVAQPRRWSTSDKGLSVGDAKYVQISGVRIPPVPGALALEMLVE